MREEIISFESLLDSLETCKHGVIWKSSVSGYYINAVENTLKLESELESGTYKARPPKEVQITRPKKRFAYSVAFRDRVYQRSLNDKAIYPQMTKGFIYDNFACQKGKGTDKAMQKLKELMHAEYVSNGGNPFSILKCDVKGYYDNIDHEIAEGLIRKKCDADIADMSIEVLRNQYKGDKGYKAGSQMVQIIGISMLDGLDHFIKEELHCKRYLRYMDDFILISSDEKYLEYCKVRISEYLAGIKLELHKDKTKIYSSKSGVMFLGFKYFVTDTGKVVMLIDSKNVKAERKKLFRMVAKYKNGEMTKEKIEECYTCWKAHAKRGNSYNLIKNMNSYLERLFMDIREQKLLEFAMANTPKTVQLSEKAESVIDFNVMMGNLTDPEEEENA